MAHSFSALYTHIVFSTKERREFLSDPATRQDVHQYLGGIVSNHDAEPLNIGGVADHVHLLVRLGRTVPVADLVRELKRGSSLWVKSKGPAYHDFAWQSGYAALSVSWQDVPFVKSYIVHQEEHHQTSTFQEEYRRLLEESGIELDERYMWE